MKLVREPFRGGHRYWFFCPGCKHAHSYLVGCGVSGQNWTFDAGSLSFSPSLRCFIPAMTVDCHHCESGIRRGCPFCNGTEKINRPEETTCHLFIRNGRIEFCRDCPHDHIGKTVDMPEFPEGYEIPEPYEVVA